MRPKPRGPEINVTPLVDVVLVLLIIFMVVIPQMDAGAAVDPPSARHIDKTANMDEEALTVNMARDGSVWIEQQEIAAMDIESLLLKRHKASPSQPLRIKADREAPYGKVRWLYRAGQQAGYPSVGLEVGELKDEEESSRGL